MFEYRRGEGPHIVGGDKISAFERRQSAARKQQSLRCSWPCTREDAFVRASSTDQVDHIRRELFTNRYLFQLRSQPLDLIGFENHRNFASLESGFRPIAQQHAARQFEFVLAAPASQS